MISCKKDLKEYIIADAMASGRSPTFSIRSWFTNPIWRYQRLLRQREYLINCKPNRGFWRIVRVLNYLRYNRLGVRLGLTIPPNTFGKGLYITHIGTIVVNHKARIGENCVLNACVNIGNNWGDVEAVPTIGKNCFIGPGAKIYGHIVIGDNVRIGANAVVNKSFPEGNCKLVGVPAKRK